MTKAKKVDDDKRQPDSKFGPGPGRPRKATPPVIVPVLPPGKPRGTLNPKTMHRKTMIDMVLHSGYAPLQIFLKVLRGDTDVTPAQFQAAVAAAPYIHPKLVSMQVTPGSQTEGGGDTIDVEAVELPTDPVEVARLYQKLMKKD